jgi:hypothetical protein
MPGFSIGGHGSGPPVPTDPKPTFIWDLREVFGDVVIITSPVVYAKEATLPAMSIKKGSMPGSALAYQFAEEVGWEDVRILWYDTQGLHKEIKKWRDKVWTPQGGLKTMSEYKALTRLAHFQHDEARGTMWKLVNSWPSRIAAGKLSYAESEANLVEVTVTYDWAEDEEFETN